MEVLGPSALWLKRSSWHLTAVFFFLLGVGVALLVLAVFAAVARALLLVRRSQRPAQQFRELLLPSGALVRIPVQ